MDEKLKTKIIELNPTQIEILYLDKDGKPLTDSSQDCHNIYWEPKFIGVDIDPLFVVSIEFPVLTYNTAKVQPVKARVVVLDLTEEERKVIRARIMSIGQAQEALDEAKTIVGLDKQPKEDKATEEK